MPIISLDYFGLLQFSAYRGRASKRYGPLINDLVTRYLYLELVQSLSTPVFLYGFRRFIGEFSTADDVYLDNGTNFVGAERVLADAVKELEKSEEFKNLPGRRRSCSSFSPPVRLIFEGHTSL